MAIGGTLFIIVIISIGIWIVVEMQRFKHKIIAVVLIFLLIFSYLSFATVIKGQNIDLSTLGGIIDATKLYFSWLWAISKNFMIITTNAIGMDWGVDNETTTKKSNLRK